MAKKKNKSEIWKEIFNAKDILSDIRADGYSFVEAALIKNAGMEPRLATNFSRRQELPQVFKENDLFLLAVKNGLYAVIDNPKYNCPARDGFMDLQLPGSIIDFDSLLPYKLETLETSSLGGEQKYIDLTFYNGIIKDFLGFETLFTIRGRNRSPFFKFNYGNCQLEVDGVQIEVDAGFESVSEIILLEAKMGNRDNFNVRQLYYPFRTWKIRVPHKDVIPVFFVYDQGTQVLNFWKYSFDEIENYHSINLVKIAGYKLNIKHNWSSFLELIIKRSPSWKITKVPQADDLNKVIKIPLAIDNDIKTSAEVAKLLNFSNRQSSYYREAAELLGLVVLSSNTYELTDIGRHFVKAQGDDRTELLLQLVIRLPVIHETLRLVFEKGQVNMEQVASIIESNTGLSGSTPRRRAQTVKSWLTVISNLIGGVIRVHGNTILKNSREVR